MFKFSFNRALIRVAITPVNPLLVRSGETSSDPTRPDIECVRTRHALVGDTVYIPGSSLKGVIRAQTERILRTLDMRCCDPLQQIDNPCHDEVKATSDRTALQYAQLCAACRTFGSTRVAGRFAPADAYPWRADAAEVDRIEAARVANLTERRNGVAIDRRTGGARKGALYDLEVVTRGSFHADLTLRNFQLWQLGVLGFVLRDIDQGQVNLGSGKSRGLGRVNLKVEEVQLEISRRAGRSELVGIGSMSGMDPYDLVAEPNEVMPSSVAYVDDSPFFHQYTAQGDAVMDLFRVCARAPWAAARQHFLGTVGGRG